MAKRFITPFAEAGDRATMPDVPVGTDSNYRTGYPSQYEEDPVVNPSTAKFVERDKSNQLYNDITANIKEWQEHVYPEFITPAVNGGVPFPYKKGSIVTDLGVDYLSLVDGNEDPTTSEKWKIYEPLGINNFNVTANPLIDGSSICNKSIVLFRAKNLKDVALNRNDADVMSDDLSGMEGYAKHAGTTGGQGEAIFWVTNGIDNDVNFEEGSLRWAVKQVTDAGQGRILFDPHNEINITLATQLIMPENSTFDAPGRNVNIYTDRDVTHLKVEATNIIIRRINFRSLPLAIPTTTRDAIFVEPTTSDKVWIDECDFTQCADGCIDVVSLSDVVTPCRVTISRNLYRNHDKVMLIGSLACYNAGSPAYCPLAIDETPQILVTIYKNWYDHTGQRHPKVVTKAFVHSINNYYHISVKDRDDGTSGANYGSLSATGGAVLSENDLFTSANGSGQEAVNSITVAWVQGADGIGASKVTGSIATDSMTMTEFNTAKVTIPPYVLTPDSIINTAAGRLDFSESIIEGAGSGIDSTIDGVYIWDENETRNPDGETVYSTKNVISGRFVKKTKIPLLAPIPIIDEVPSSSILIPRDGTVDIISGVVTFDPLYSNVAIDTEGATASDTVDNIAGLADDAIYYARAASSSRDVVFSNGVGNVFTNSGVAITLTSAQQFVTIYYNSNTNRYTVSL